MIELVDVVKIYPGTAEPAVNHVSFKVPAGETCVLIGPSGCGKPTTLKLVNRLVEPTSGEIWLDGANILQQDPVQIRRHIGYVIQQIGLFPHMTVRDNIATVPRLLGWKRPRIDARVDELLAMVGMEPASYRDRYPRELSGGQQQRVGVARALAADPPVMLMDEPFGAIDPINRERLQNEFLRLQRELRKTIVFVTHDIDEAIKMGDRIAILEKGGVLAQYATPAELLMTPASEFVADFVGADRALKRLALQRVRDIDLWTTPLAHVGEPVAAARARAADSDLDLLLLVDEETRPVRWLRPGDLVGETVPDVTRDPPLVTVDGEDLLRDGLSDLLQHGAQYAPVTDGRGRVIGILSLEVITTFLGQQTQGHIDEVPSAAERAAR